MAKKTKKPAPVAAVSKTNWFAIWVTTAAVAVVAIVVGATVLLNQQAVSPGTVPTAANVSAETGALTFGTGETQVDTYVDFMCPFCGQFETNVAPSINEAVAAGTVTLNLHPIATLDGLSMGTQFSTRAANATYCVADQVGDASLPFITAMFESQPEESTEGLTDEQIIQIAQDSVGVDITDCLTERPYDKFVAFATSTLPDNPTTGSGQTPTMLIDDEYISITYNAETDFLSRIG